MKQRVTRRMFLTATATALSAVGCNQVPPAPQDRKEARRPTATPRPLRNAAERGKGYVLVAPRVFRSGLRAAVSIALFDGGTPLAGTVALALVKDGKAVMEQAGEIDGRGTVELNLPQLEPGEYEVTLNAAGMTDRAPVRVESAGVLFVETDKPIYKPGQTIHIRLLMLDALLRPTSGKAVVDVLDAQGIRIFRRHVAVDEWGMAAVELPLSSEPNLGMWKVEAASGDRSSQIDVRVERYVLPKYEVKVELARPWALTNETIRGTVAAEYSFGKPVVGEVEIVARRYVGAWEEYARVTQQLDGRSAFELPPVQFVAGSPEGGGLGNVQLNVTVREQATGYAETTSQLVTIAAMPIHLQLIPESKSFKPGLPFGLLLVAETPDKQPVDIAARIRIVFEGENFEVLGEEQQSVTTQHGVALVHLTPPEGALSMMVEGAGQNADAAVARIGAVYSPSGSFIHLEQISQGQLKVGDTARFRVATTHQTRSLFYEVVARGMVAYSGRTEEPEIEIVLTPGMAPEARVLVYHVLDTAEVAADYLPLTVLGDYPHAVTAAFDAAEARPADEVTIAIQSAGEARVGLAVVDRSVFMLAENRLNLQQVFDELERLYSEPRAELHDVEAFDPFAPLTIPGAKETFQGAGVLVLTNQLLPEGKQIQREMAVAGAAAGGAAGADTGSAGPAATTEAATLTVTEGKSGGLAEVQRVRQFFPETWLWTTLATDSAGSATHKVTAPDSITTWVLRVVALSKEHGLGIVEGQLRVFQPFFAQIDLPYAAIRGEEFPAKVALYNYRSTAEDVTVELSPSPWFDLLDVTSKTVSVAANTVGAVEFTIRPKELGVHGLTVTARSRAAADAITKELIVEPEGMQREIVTNLVLAPASPRTVGWSLPADVISGSARGFIAITGNMLSQTIDGLESLLQMPFGCGEQNMLLFAPDVFITRYLRETGQEKPEIMAKAEKLMLTGYQRELTYRRSDGSFSAFGQSDPVGSLWLTAFVLKTFAQARDLIYIDEGVLGDARTWIGGQQRADGSFTPVGFVHHQELLGGLSGTTALTAYVAIALKEAGDELGAQRAADYLEAQLESTQEVYALAITTYALTLMGSRLAQRAIDRLLALAEQSNEGLSWGDTRKEVPAETPLVPGMIEQPVNGSAAIETTGYAALALQQHGDRINSGKALRWLVSRRNASGGFGSTQDTVVALQALTTAAGRSLDDINATIVLSAGDWQQSVEIRPENADVVQVVEVPVGFDLQIEPRGRGEVMGQLVQRFNVAVAETAEHSVFQLDVRYDADQVEVDDLITVRARITFTPPPTPTGVPTAAGMVVLDVAVPTGFAPVAESVDALVQREAVLKRWELAGRKVILYIEDMRPNQELVLEFEARALYPVRAQPVSSRVYSYYKPEWKGEYLGSAVVVAG